MGFYFKKSIKIGPFRINFSKSGISVSLGVKGASVNVGPKTSSVNVGRKGVYYKKSISTKKLLNKKDT
ncbi:DUF4236 domain-containing protein [bacterium]|nr:DUF4236 domain-containing protein [bacterium]